MDSSISRPPQERLNTLPQWAADYIRDLEFEVEWLKLKQAGSVSRAEKRLRRSMQGIRTRVATRKPKGVLF